MTDSLDQRSLNVIGKKLYAARIAQPPEPSTAFMYLLDAVDDMYALLCSHFEPPPDRQKGGMR